MTDITPFGFWILVDGVEYFVPFDDYPEFRAATVSEFYSMERIGPGQVRWSRLDVDIEVEALDRPDAYPLRFSRERALDRPPSRS